MITTNFDPSLENAISAENLAAGRPACTALDLGDPRSFSVFDFFRLTGRGNTTEFVLHLHGVHDHPDRVILAASDYSKGYGDFTSSDRDGLPLHLTLDVILRKVIWALLVTYPTLFVGFSLNDPAFKHILKVTSADFQRGRSLGHFAIVGAGQRTKSGSAGWRGSHTGSRRSFTASCARQGWAPTIIRTSRRSSRPSAAELGVDLGLDPIGAFTDRMLDL